MKKNRKKGFSLVELIVVIAVIAAIAAIIVPQFGNFTGAAKAASDEQNIKTWNQVYMNGQAALGSTDASGNAELAKWKVGSGEENGTLVGGTYKKDGASVPSISITGEIVGDESVTFSAPGFPIQGTATYTFNKNEGLVKE